MAGLPQGWGLTHSVPVALDPRLCIPYLLIGAGSMITTSLIILSEWVVGTLRSAQGQIS